MSELRNKIAEISTQTDIEELCTLLCEVEDSLKELQENDENEFIPVQDHYLYALTEIGIADGGAPRDSLGIYAHTATEFLVQGSGGKQSAFKVIERYDVKSLRNELADLTDDYDGAARYNEIQYELARIFGFEDPAEAAYDNGFAELMQPSY